MKLILFAWSLIFLLNAPTVAAKTFSLKNETFSLDLPQGWRDVKELYGIPLTLLGPSVSLKPRAVIQVIPTSLPNTKWSEVDAKKFGDEYAEGRKRWVKEQQGELLELLPGKYADHRLSAGVSYKLNQKRYLERTYYVSCPKQIFHLKIILNFENLDSLKTSEDIVRSFSCDK